MRSPHVLVLAAVVSLTACTQSARSPTPKTDDDKALYSLGVMLSQQVISFEFSEKELEMIKAGVADGARNKPQLEMEEMEGFMPKLQELHQARVTAAAEREKAAGTTYVEKAASEAGANQTASGLVYRTVTEGTGDSPQATDMVKVHYEGRFVDGKVFDSSHERNEPATFPLNGVIPCWTEAVQLMKVGGKANVVCPPDIAYGERGPQGRVNATLVFDVELLEIVKDQ